MDNLEHRYDVPFLRFAELRDKQNRCGQQSFCGIVKISVLPERTSVHAGENDGLGDNFGVLLGFSFVGQLVGIRLVQIHILVDKVKQIVPIGAGRVAQVNHRNVVTVTVFRHHAIIAEQISFCIGGQE